LKLTNIYTDKYTFFIYLISQNLVREYPFQSQTKIIQISASPLKKSQI